MHSLAFLLFVALVGASLAYPASYDAWKRRFGQYRFGGTSQGTGRHSSGGMNHYGMPQGAGVNMEGVGAAVGGSGSEGGVGGGAGGSGPNRMPQGAGGNMESVGGAGGGSGSEGGAGRAGGEYRQPENTGNQETMPQGSNNQEPGPSNNQQQQQPSGDESQQANGWPFGEGFGPQNGHENSMNLGNFGENPPFKRRNFPQFGQQWGGQQVGQLNSLGDVYDNIGQIPPGQGHGYQMPNGDPNSQYGEGNSLNHQFGESYQGYQADDLGNLFGQGDNGQDDLDGILQELGHLFMKRRKG